MSVKKGFYIYVTALLLVAVGLWVYIKKYRPSAMIQTHPISKAMTVRIDDLADRIRHYFPDKPDSAGYLIDSLAKINHQTKKDSNTLVKGLRAMIYCFQYKPKDTHALFMPLITICKSKNDKRTELNLWKCWEYYLVKADTARAFSLYCDQKIIALAKELGEINSELQYKINIADAYFMRGQYSACEKQLKEVTADPRFLHSNQVYYAYDRFSVLYINTGDYPNAIRYTLKSEKYIMTTRDSSTENVLYLYERLETIYNDLGQYKQSIFYCQKEIDHAIASNYSIYIFTMGSNMVTFLLADNRPREALNYISELRRRYKYDNVYNAMAIQSDLGRCYAELRDYRQAEVCFKEIIRLEKSAGPEILPLYIRGQYYRQIGEFYLKFNQYELAKKHLLVSFNILHASLDVRNADKLYAALFKVDSALKNYPQAIQYLERRNTMKDSIFNIKKQKQISELQIAYQSEKKDKELQLSKAKIKSDGLEKASLQSTRNWIFGFVVVLIVVSGMLYRISSLRKKNNRQINAKNLLLEAILKEKEWLLKEVHHRVKNNLHTVICLLESQAAYLENDALKAIEISQHRIYAMSLIHQKLYQTEDIESIDMSAYAKDFLNYLKDAFGQEDRIKIKSDVEPFQLGASQAIPLGLIINESVTNSYKYAFPDERIGTIHISLHQSADLVELLIADDGIGMKVSTNFDDSASLGMQLIRGLARDLNAQLKIDGCHGTSIRVLFEIKTFDKPFSDLNVAVSG